MLNVIYIYIYILSIFHQRQSQKFCEQYDSYLIGLNLLIVRVLST